MTSEKRYVIASLKHTNKDHEHITFWGKDWCGYVIVIDDRIGEYPESEFSGHLNDGVDCIAVPLEVVKSIQSPTPYFNSGGKARPFYDIAGCVVDNTRENWNQLIEASLPRAGNIKPKPTLFRRKRRSFSIEVSE
jgi:hypothetical protein